jgi:two-component system cell cycle response regulator CpdR
MTHSVTSKIQKLNHGPDARMSPDRDPAALRAGKRILIAEDDEPLRGMLRKALKISGFEVDDVGTGDAARDAYMQRCPDVLLADLVLPGLNGQELATACREHCPDTIMIFMSGYTEDDLHRLNITQVVFLPKPIYPADLVRTLDRLLAARDASASP